MNVAIVISTDDQLALQGFSRRWWNENQRPNLADAATCLVRVSLAHPELLERQLAADIRYAAAEDLPLARHWAQMIRRCGLHRPCGPEVVGEIFSAGSFP